MVVEMVLSRTFRQCGTMIELGGDSSSSFSFTMLIVNLVGRLKLLLGHIACFTTSLQLSRQPVLLMKLFELNIESRQHVERCAVACIRSVVFYG